MRPSEPFYLSTAFWLAVVGLGVFGIQTAAALSAADTFAAGVVAINWSTWTLGAASAILGVVRAIKGVSEDSPAPRWTLAPEVAPPAAPADPTVVEPSESDYVRRFREDVRRARGERGWTAVGTACVLAGIGAVLGLLLLVTSCGPHLTRLECPAGAAPILEVESIAGKLPPAGAVVARCGPEERARWECLEARVVCEAGGASYVVCNDGHRERRIDVVDPDGVRCATRGGGR